MTRRAVDFAIFKARVWRSLCLLHLAVRLAPESMRPHIVTGIGVMLDEVRLSDEFA